MGLSINWAPKVLQTLKRSAPAGGERWLSVTELALESGVGLGMAAINLKAAERRGYAEVRKRPPDQVLEYRATEALTLGDPDGPMYDEARGAGTARLG